MKRPDTYSGTTIGIADALPETNDAAGFAAIEADFVTGDCAIHEVPEIAREWDSVDNPVVCENTSFEVKGGAKYSKPSYKLNRFPDDAAQAIYEAMENDPAGVASFRVKVAGESGKSGTLYFTAQVSKFTLMDGGGKNTLHTSTATLCLQSDPVFVPTPAAP